MDEPISQSHGPIDVCWDNLGEGFRIGCLCGWISSPSKSVAGAGQQFDDHLCDVFMGNE
jgi:hypothetical protein